MATDFLDDEERESPSSQIARSKIEVSAALARSMRRQVDRFENSEDWTGKTGVTDFVGSAGAATLMKENPKLYEEVVKKTLEIEISERQAFIDLAQAQFEQEKIASEAYVALFKGWRLYAVFFSPLLVSAGLALSSKGAWGFLILVVCYGGMAALLLRNAEILRDLQKEIGRTIGKLRK